MIFEKPSLRTRVTFDVGIYQLGGHPIYLSPAEINLGKRESVYDVAKNLERMVQGIMIRTFAHQIVEELAAFASIPVINGLTDYSHPCQAMADYLTIWELKGTRGRPEDRLHWGRQQRRPFPHVWRRAAWGPCMDRNACWLRTESRCAGVGRNSVRLETGGKLIDHQ